MGILDSLSGIAEMPAGGITTAILNSPIWGKVYFFIKIAMSMGLFFFGGVAIYKFWLQYNVSVTIYKRIGTSGFEVVHDKAKILTDVQNKIKLQMFKTRKGRKKPCTSPIPEAKYKGKKGKHDHYNFWMDDNQELHPIDAPIVKNNVDRLEIVPQERAAWARKENEILMKRYEKKDMLLKYATPAILMTACITAFLIFFFASKEIGSGLTSLANQFAQVAASCTRIG